MNYTESVQYLNSFLNMEKMAAIPKNRLWNLERMKLLLRWTGHPEKNYFPVLIAGTKGKGSSGYFLETILRGNRIPVGFYHSPHLSDPKERIRINGRMISKSSWTRGLKTIQTLLNHRRPPSALGDFTYFELMTLLAVMEFKRQRVEVGIFEIGMGGRLDASNSIDAKVAMLTPIHLDHEAFLGKTVSKIAGEKAAIIRRFADVVVSHQPKAAKRVIDQELKRKAAKSWSPIELNGHKIGLEGVHQKMNAGTALRTAWILKDRYGFSVSKEKAYKALAHGFWPGRLEYFPGRPRVLLDVAHNPAAMTALAAYLSERFESKKTLLIFGCAKDKNWQAMMRVLAPFFKEIIVTQARNPRSETAGRLAASARYYFERVYAMPDPADALALAKAKAGQYPLTVGTGSFYLVGEMRSLILSRKRSVR